MTIDSVKMTGGDACKHAVAVVSPDATAFTVGFSQFDAGVGQTPPLPISAQCHVHLEVTIPKGWQYALATVDYVGYATLDSGVTASRQSIYHISGEAPDKTIAYVFPSGFDDTYFVSDIGAGSPLYFSRCGKGKNLTIETKLSVDNIGNPTGQGAITVDAIDGEVIHLIWQQCN